MDFIKNDQRRRCVFANHMRKEIIVLKKLLPVIGNIPIPIQTVGKISRNELCQGRFARLTGAGQKNHRLFPRQFLPDLNIRSSFFHVAIIQLTEK